MERGFVKVKDWFWDKLNEQMKAYNCYIIGEYVEGILDHTTLRVNEIVKETEKAVQVVVDAETANGNYKAWKTWIPKSVVIA